MLKKIIYTVLCAALILNFCGCTAEKTQDDASSVRSITFTDDLGREVTVEKAVRVATLLGSFTDVWMLAGGQVVAAPDDAWEDFEFDLPADTVNIGNVKNPSLEKLLMSDPDFVIASSKTRADLNWLDTLEKAGITVAYFGVSDFDGYLRMLKICTDITGRHDLYEKNGLAVKDGIEKAIAQSKARLENGKSPSVLSLRASASSIRAKASEGNVLGEMLRDLGCVNIADTNGSLLENLSIEYIIKSDPDFIFFVQSGDDYEGMKRKTERFISDNPAWNSLTAVKKNRVFLLDKELYNMKPNARWAEAYTELEKILAGTQK